METEEVLWFHVTSAPLYSAKKRSGTKVRPFLIFAGASIETALPLTMAVFSSGCREICISSFSARTVLLSSCHATEYPRDSRMPRMGTNTRSFSIKGASANETALSSRKMRMDAAAAVCMEHKKRNRKRKPPLTNRFMVVHFLSSIKYITEQSFADKI